MQVLRGCEAASDYSVCCFAKSVAIIFVLNSVGDQASLRMEWICVCTEGSFFLSKSGI